MTFSIEDSRLQMLMPLLIHATHARASLPRADQFQREVLGEQVAVAEEDDQVDLELNLEVSSSSSQ